MSTGRNPIPVGEAFRSPSGRTIWIDHKRLVRELEPKAVCETSSSYGYLIYSFDDKRMDAPDEEPSLLGSGRTESDAWRDAHLFLTDHEKLCPHCGQQLPEEDDV